MKYLAGNGEVIRFDDDIAFLLEDSEFVEKLESRLEKSDGWSFMIRHRGLSIRVGTSWSGVREAWLEEGTLPQKSTLEAWL